MVLSASAPSALAETGNSYTYLISQLQFAVLGLGFDFAEKMKEEIKNVTSEQILKCAQKCFSDKYVLAIIKP